MIVDHLKKDLCLGKFKTNVPLQMRMCQISHPDLLLVFYCPGSLLYYRLYECSGLLLHCNSHKMYQTHDM